MLHKYKVSGYLVDRSSGAVHYFSGLETMAKTQAQAKTQVAHRVRKDLAERGVWNASRWCIGNAVVESNQVRPVQSSLF